MQTKTKRVQNRGTPRASCPTNGQNCAFSDLPYLWGKFSLRKRANDKLPFVLLFFTIRYLYIFFCHFPFIGYTLGENLFFLRLFFIIQIFLV